MKPAQFFRKLMTPPQCFQEFLENRSNLKLRSKLRNLVCEDINGAILVV